MKIKNQDPFEITDEEIELVLEEAGLSIAQGRTNEEWIKSLEARLTMQRRDFAALLDHAAENPELLKFCDQARRDMQNTKQRLADCRLLQACCN
jgi:hypothetical protein